MAILIDTPQRYPKYGLCSHMISDLHGAEGHAELVAFAKQIGMREQWIQNKGTHREHFDVMRGKIDVAKAHGAKMLSPRELVEIMYLKPGAPPSRLNGQI